MLSDAERAYLRDLRAYTKALRKLLAITGPDNEPPGFAEEIAAGEPWAGDEVFTYWDALIVTLAVFPQDHHELPDTSGDVDSWVGPAELWLKNRGRLLASIRVLLRICKEWRIPMRRGGTEGEWNIARYKFDLPRSRVRFIDEDEWRPVVAPRIGKEDHATLSWACHAMERLAEQAEGDERGQEDEAKDTGGRTVIQAGQDTLKPPREYVQNLRDQLAMFAIECRPLITPAYRAADAAGAIWANKLKFVIPAALARVDIACYPDAMRDGRGRLAVDDPDRYRLEATGWGDGFYITMHRLADVLVGLTTRWGLLGPPPAELRFDMTRDDLEEIAAIVDDLDRRLTGQVGVIEPASGGPPMQSGGTDYEVKDVDAAAGQGTAESDPSAFIQVATLDMIAALVQTSSEALRKKIERHGGFPEPVRRAGHGVASRYPWLQARDFLLKHYPVTPANLPLWYPTFFLEKPAGHLPDT